MTDALAVNDSPRRPHHGRGFAMPANLCRAKVAREPKPPPAPAVQTEVAAIVQPSAAMLLPPNPIHSFSNYEGLIEAFRSAKDLRGLSNEHTDDLANLAKGHTDAVLGPTGRKTLGRLSFNALLWALGVKLVMVVDVEREAEMAVHWADRQRQSPHVREPSRVSKILIERATPYVNRARAMKGWETRRARKSAQINP